MAGGVASHAGTRLLTDLVDRSGLTGAFSDALTGLRSRRAGHDPGQVLVDVAVLLTDGDEAISDLAQRAEVGRSCRSRWLARESKLAAGGGGWRRRSRDW